MTNKNPKQKRLAEQTLASELVYRSGFLQIIRDQVLLPNGKKAQREYYQHPGASLVIPRLSDGSLIMVEQYRHALKRTFLEFPAGKKDPGEDFSQTAQRELEEETGYFAENVKYLTTIHPVIGYSTEEIQIFLAEDMQMKTQRTDPGEFLNVIEISFTELEEKVKSGLVTDVKTQIAFFWLKNFLE